MSLELLVLFLCNIYSLFSITVSFHNTKVYEITYPINWPVFCRDHQVHGNGEGTECHTCSFSSLVLSATSRVRAEISEAKQKVGTSLKDCLFVQTRLHSLVGLTFNPLAKKSLTYGLAWTHKPTLD